MKQCEKGFTLIESLIVLACFTMLASVALFGFEPHNKWSESKVFLTQFQTDLLYAQQYAISHQREVTITITAGKHTYLIHDQTLGAVLIERFFSEAVDFLHNSFSFQFKFLAGGNVNKFGSLYIQIEDQLFRMTILIGKGRFYVTEE